jgi:hypothetical protein
MTAVQAGREQPPATDPAFARRHRWDNAYLLANIALIAAATVIGFGVEIVHRYQTHAPAYPLIVHLHAVAFSAWLALLAAQILLIRAHRVALHRRLGVAGAALAALMVILGVAVSFVVGRLEQTGPHPQPGFLFVRLADMVSFALLATAAIATRRTPAAHKRLILLATLQIADAGFGRTLGPLISPWIGETYLATLVVIFLGNDLLVLGLGAYDLFTRRSLHPVYLPAIACVFGSQMAGVWLYHAPWIQPFAARLLGG